MQQGNVHPLITQKQVTWGLELTHQTCCELQDFNQSFGSQVGTIMAGFGVPGTVSLLTVRSAPELNPYNAVGCINLTFPRHTRSQALLCRLGQPVQCQHNWAGSESGTCMATGGACLH